VLCQMTNILGRQTVVMVPGELGIKLSSQTGSDNHYSNLSFIHEVIKQFDFLQVLLR
jgi:hypothetical protein